MTYSYDLAKLGPEAFENIVNFLTMKTLGLGATGFAPGADNGRDGYFEGEAPYPSSVEKWKGVWYIQSKFHRPHLTTNAQNWIVDQVRKEIDRFEDEDSEREWPDNWIIATNVDLTASAKTGSFDKIKKIIREKLGDRKINVDVWGGKKIVELLNQHREVADYYGHFLTPGHIITKLYQRLESSRPQAEQLIRYLVVTQFTEHMFTKLDQAGSSSDSRPKVHELFIDLPYSPEGLDESGLILRDFTSAATQCHKYSLRKKYPEEWQEWHKMPRRARVCLIKGGPGQGKSTVGQYLCQIHRAAIILGSNDIRVVAQTSQAAEAVRRAAEECGFWATSPRIPVQIELKEYAHWFSQRELNSPRGVLTYLADKIERKLGTSVPVQLIREALSADAWLVVFDGLDEVPNDYKNNIADEILYFLNDVVIEIDSDVMSICTSRPQGYSGQFSSLDGPVINLSLLDPARALCCAEPLLRYGRTADEAETSIGVLKNAVESPNVRELMTTPLQSHIMAVVVRDGGRPPERRWNLFNSFYLVMKKRESLKSFQDPRIARLLREEDRLLKSVHNRLGFVLHARAERSEGAQTMLSRSEFRNLVKDAVIELVENEIEETVNVVMEATTERLVLVSTPENGEHVRFDIRQLQEFFAAEFLYDGVDANELASRIDTIGGDAHWREVVHFLISALIENRRTSELSVVAQRLRAINEGEEAGANSLFHRRMARSGLLAGRLLIEGVLEQDQRDRHQLRPLFDPLGGLFDIGSLAELGRIIPPRSRHWLALTLMEKLATNHPRETVGCIYILGWLAQPETPGYNTLPAAFGALPLNYRKIIISNWQRNKETIYRFARRSKTRDELSEWVFDVAAGILNSDSCFEYEYSHLQSLHLICESNSIKFRSALTKIGLDDNTSAVLDTCINIEKILENEPEGHVVQCGIVEATEFRCNWRNQKLPKELANLPVSHPNPELRGVFRIIFNIFKFSRLRTPESLWEAANLLHSAGEKGSRAISLEMLALLPIPDCYSLKKFCVNHIIEAGEKSVNLEQIAKEIFGPYENLMLKPFDHPTDNDWDLCLQHVPTVALNVILNREIYKNSERPLTEAMRRIFLENMPFVIKNIYRWGDLIEMDAALLSDIRREATILDLDSLSVDFEDTPLFWLSPFKIDLNTEIILLAVIAPCVVQWVREREVYGFAPVRQGARTLEEVFDGYGLNQSTLRDIYQSDKYGRNVRAGAAALFWLSQAQKSKDNLASNEITAYLNLYQDVVTPKNEKWLTSALVNGIIITQSENNNEARWAATQLMLRCLDGEGPRDQLIELIRSWRERSNEPVHASQVLNHWLSYRFSMQ
jgi:hypothetical protein